jgi:hypothetical protein
MAIKRPILFAGAGVLLLSFFLKLNFGFFLALAVAFLILTLALSFIFKKQRLQIILVAFAFLVFIFVGSFANSNVSFIKNNVDRNVNASVFVDDVRQSEYGFAAVGKLKHLNGKRLFATKIRLYLSDEQQVCRGDKIEISANISLMEDNNHYFSQNVFAQGKNVPDKPEEEIDGAEQLALEIEEDQAEGSEATAEVVAEETPAAPEEETSAEDDIIDYE